MAALPPDEPLPVQAPSRPGRPSILLPRIVSGVATRGCGGAGGAVALAVRRRRAAPAWDGRVAVMRHAGLLGRRTLPAGGPPAEGYEPGTFRKGRAMASWGPGRKETTVSAVMRLRRAMLARAGASRRRGSLGFVTILRGAMFGRSLRARRLTAVYRTDHPPTGSAAPLWMVDAPPDSKPLSPRDAMPGRPRETARGAVNPADRAVT